MGWFSKGPKPIPVHVRLTLHRPPGSSIDLWGMARRIERQVSRQGGPEASGDRVQRRAEALDRYVQQWEAESAEDGARVLVMVHVATELAAAAHEGLTFEVEPVGFIVMVEEEAPPPAPPPAPRRMEELSEEELLAIVQDEAEAEAEDG